MRAFEPSTCIHCSLCMAPCSSCMQEQHVLPVTAMCCLFWQGLVVDPDEQERLARNVGASNTMFMRNHGILTIGKTIGGGCLYGPFIPAPPCGFPASQQLDGCCEKSGGAEAVRPSEMHEKDAHHAVHALVGGRRCAVPDGPAHPGLRDPGEKAPHAFFPQCCSH